MIKIKTVYGILPVVILYITEHDMTLNFDAWTNGPVIIIKEKYEFDKSLLVHELEHVKCWYKCFGKEETEDKQNQEELHCYVMQLKYIKKYDKPNFENCFKKITKDIYQRGLTKSIEEAREIMSRKLK
jgi:hypothetical protein